MKEQSGKKLEKKKVLSMKLLGLHEGHHNASKIKGASSY
jgi:hypothetical protein